MKNDELLPHRTGVGFQRQAAGQCHATLVDVTLEIAAIWPWAEENISESTFRNLASP
jgi:hypothetical protein